MHWQERDYVEKENIACVKWILFPVFGYGFIDVPSSVCIAFIHTLLTFICHSFSFFSFVCDIKINNWRLTFLNFPPTLSFTRVVRSRDILNRFQVAES